ncbi:conserved protein of unknown function [Candidatus Promineifilum breve]|uniref:DUF2442 domain-containing protein n=1 Tax=Candidatus Promineifilum breve TaxID=1806508 RepID=A0A161K364_9CHLR|nr:DUF2442 domain-containing protein [Candidatus Promineifilum breve]CUS03847.2 conserved protein of unknown function [Candidatus Promineifilum breve]
MDTSQNEIVELVQATNVEFEGDMLHVALSDGRRVSLPLDTISWLSWLASATSEQRANWSIEPGGYGVYWEELDDGFEVMHLLNVQPLA